MSRWPILAQKRYPRANRRVERPKTVAETKLHKLMWMKIENEYLGEKSWNNSSFPLFLCQDDQFWPINVHIEPNGKSSDQLPLQRQSSISLCGWNLKRLMPRVWQIIFNVRSNLVDFMGRRAEIRALELSSRRIFARRTIFTKNYLFIGEILRLAKNFFKKLLIYRKNCSPGEWRSKMPKKVTEQSHCGN